MKWVYETGIEKPEILGSGSQYESVVASTDFESILRAFYVGNRNYLIRRRYENGCMVREEYDSSTQSFRPL